MTSHRVPLDHASHDLLLVAAHVAGDTAAEDASRATALLAVCADCRQVAGELAAITTASRALPPPERSRDFRLTPEQAARIRNRSIWDRLAGALLAPRGAARAVPAGLMTLGLAALLISAVPGLPGAATPQAARDTGGQELLGPAGGPTNVDSRTGGEPGPAAPEVVKSTPGASGAPNLAPPVTSDAAASPAAGRNASEIPAGQAGGAPAGPTNGPASPAPAAPTEAAADRGTIQAPPALLIVSIVLFGAGILLLVARRVTPRPGA